MVAVSLDIWFLAFVLALSLYVWRVLQILGRRLLLRERSTPYAAAAAAAAAAAVE